MSIAGNSPSDKISQLLEMATELGEFVERAAIDGQTLYDVERGAFDRLLKMGQTVVDRFLVMQGDGDLGEIASASDGQPIYRSVEPVSRQLRTIFGQHQFFADVYRERTHPNTAIVFRPIDAR